MQNLLDIIRDFHKQNEEILNRFRNGTLREYIKEQKDDAIRENKGLAESNGISS